VIPSTRLQQITSQGHSERGEYACLQSYDLIASFRGVRALHFKQRNPRFIRRRASTLMAG
jgi:hypothetical protein